MKKRNLLFLIISGLMIFSSAHAQKKDYFSNFPEGKTPEEIGIKITENLLSRDFRRTKFLSSKGEGAIHYAEIVTAYGAIKFSDQIKDRNLLLRLEKRYRPIVDEKDSDLIPEGFHGDFTVFALVPFELYRLRGDERFYNLGMKMVKEQWQYTNPEDGLTWQARWWIDDAYMIASVDALATRITGDQTWVNNSALLLDAYCSKLQQENGLLPHSDMVPEYWSRGVGWVAAGLTEALTTMDEEHPMYDDIMGHYKKLMAGLLAIQEESGLWNQLLDFPDYYINEKNDTIYNWEETSGTGMFTYSFIMGINNGWLDAKTYGPAARKGWLALCEKINEKGEIIDVCVGTNEMHGAEAYLQRKRRTGDFHGQAPVLWCVNALLQ